MRTAWLPATGLFVLAPVCAEYLWGYDDTTGDAAVLIGGLIIFGPLYGAPALLIREAARRLGLGWPGILLLAAAFGVIEAGLVDQSMFNQGYRDIPYWDDMSVPTFVGPLGLSVYPAVMFVGGHVVQSIGAPIAVVETLTPGRRHEPWLSRPVIVVVALLYVAASALVLADTLDTESDHASLGQLVGASLAVAGLVVAAVLVGRRPAPVVPGRAPSPWLVGAGGFLALLAFTQLPPSRVGTTAVVAVAVLTILVVRRLARRGDWDQRRVLALAGGALLAAGVGAFWTDPIGDVSVAAKYAHNVVLLLLVAALVGWGARRARDRPGST